MKWGLHYREFLGGLSQWLVAEFEQITHALNTWSANVTTGTLTAEAMWVDGYRQPVTQWLAIQEDFSVTSSATIQAVSKLEAAVVNGRRYAFEAVLFLKGGAGGYRVDIHGTGLASSVIYHTLMMDNDTDAILVSVHDTVLGSNHAGGATPATAFAIIRGTMRAESDGYLRVGFAQAGASGASSNVLPGSRLQVSELPE